MSDAVSDIHYIILPEYSTERYFLLSEIEANATSLTFLDDDETDSYNKNNSRESHNSELENIKVYYVLWDLSLSLPVLLHSIESVTLRISSENISSKLLVIDVFCSQTGICKNIKNLNSVIVPALSSIQDKYKCFDCIVFGITDHKSAAPGLDIAFDRLAVLGNQGLRWSITASNKTDFFGHGINITPDAIDNVNQCAISSPNFDGWIKNILRNHGKNDCIAAPNKVQLKKTNEFISDPIRATGILFAVLSMLAWWFIPHG